MTHALMLPKGHGTMTHPALDGDDEPVAELYAVIDAARYLDRPRRYIERHTAAGDLHASRLAGGRRYFTRAELDSYASARDFVRLAAPTAARGWNSGVFEHPDCGPVPAKD